MPSWRDMVGVRFDETQQDDLTFMLDAAIVAADEGKVVKVSANGTVALCVAEDVFYGKLIQIDTAPDAGAVRCCTCCVQVSYTGAPALNYVELVADGLGGVKPPAVVGTGRKMFVLTKDAGAGTLVMCCP